ncbi:MAG: aminotransferase class V-fold PLP-dependent enzyme [Syntrophobacteraceae bacterium]
MVLYLDNAAASWPKPPSVLAAVERALREMGGSPGRGSHRMARSASDLVSRARERAAGLLGVGDPSLLAFTRNATESLNLVIKGWVRPGDRVLISPMEHNSVVRPLERMKADSVQVDVMQCRPGGRIDVEALAAQLESKPRLAVLNHASNVNGALQPVAEVARVCWERGVPLLLDAAQTAGLQRIDVDGWKLGMLACSGHKGLLGPPGVGIVFIRSDLDVQPLEEGGTGSRSEEAFQPLMRPDRYESGTGNLPGIAGLMAGIDALNEHGIESILSHELGLAARLEAGLVGLPGVRVPSPEVRGTGTVSFVVDGMNAGDVAFLLDETFDIAVRSGLHCAPAAHRTLLTFPDGTVRVSPGYATTEVDVDYFLDSLGTLLKRRARS